MKWTYGFFSGIIGLFIFDAITDYLGVTVSDAYTIEWWLTFSAAWLVGIGVGYAIGAFVDCCNARTHYYEERTRRWRFIKDIDENFDA